MCLHQNKFKRNLNHSKKITIKNPHKSRSYEIFGHFKCQTTFGSVSFPHSSLISRIDLVRCDYDSVIHFILVKGKQLSTHTHYVQLKLVHPSTTISPFHSCYLILSLLCPSVPFPGQCCPGLCVCLKSGGRVWSEPFSRGLLAYEANLSGSSLPRSWPFIQKTQSPSGASSPIFRFYLYIHSNTSHTGIYKHQSESAQ